MKPFAATFLVMSLTLLGACSTGRVSPPLVKEKITVLDPPPVLLELCREPALVPSKTTADIVNNSLARDKAFGDCSARHTCLVVWYSNAKKVAAEKGAAAVPPIPEGCKP
jgi:hypothetical protein